MASPHDLAFAGAAVKQRMLTSEQVNLGTKSQKVLAELGINKSLAVIAVEAGWMELDAAFTIVTGLRKLGVDHPEVRPREASDADEALLERLSPAVRKRLEAASRTLASLFYARGAGTLALDQGSPTPVRAARKPADPTPTPPPAFTDAELDLIAHIRADARRDCTPRRSDLPDGATAGVECRPSAGPALRVGYYALPTNRAAARAYFDRIVTSGVEPNSGDCWSGEPGDLGWIPGDGEPDLVDNRDYGIVVANSPYVTHRIGCFLHEGTANVRLTCGDGRYVGVLGRNDDLEALFRWSDQYPPGVPMDTPSAPGLCITG